eukprot:1136809-Pelagomonas_calceolata.AAC.5
MHAEATAYAALLSIPAPIVTRTWMFKHLQEEAGSEGGEDKEAGARGCREMCCTQYQAVS